MRGMQEGLLAPALTIILSSITPRVYLGNSPCPGAYKPCCPDADLPAVRVAGQHQIYIGFPQVVHIIFRPMAKQYFTPGSFSIAVSISLCP